MLESIQLYFKLCTMCCKSCDRYRHCTLY